MNSLYKNSNVYKATTIASVIFIIIISVVFGMTIYQFQVGIKKTVDLELRQIRKNLSKIIAQSSSGELTDAIRILNSELETKIQKVADLIPPGTLMSFNMSECPIGWTRFDKASGRVIIASGSGTGLTRRQLGETGGEERHTLLLSEIPRHYHNYIDDNYYIKSSINNEGISLEFSDSNSLAINKEIKKSRESGSSESHNNMQPYYVASICIKSDG